MIIQFTSIFDGLEDEELVELKVRLADWMTEASYAHAMTGDIGYYHMMHEYGDLHREVRRVRQSRKKVAA